MAQKQSTTSEGTIIQINEAQIKDHLGEIVRGTVQDTLNALLDEEATRLCNARKYERTQGRTDTRAGHYTRTLQTKAGEVDIRMPKLRVLPFETAIIDRYRRRESSVEEALVEMYLAGVSVRRVEDITEALWGSKVSPGTISNLNARIYTTIEEWRQKPIEGEHPYVYLDGISLKRSWGGEVRNVSILVAFGVSREGYREILGLAEGAREDKESWTSFLRYLKDRGLKGVELFTSDKCIGLVESLGAFYPDALWQRCIVHFYRNVFSVIPKGKIKEIVAMLTAIHAQEDRKEAQKKARTVVEKLKAMKLGRAAQALSEGIDETLSYYSFPREHWRKIRTNNPLERIMKEIRRRTRVVGSFPDGNSALMLVAARLRHIAGTKWGMNQYMKMERLQEAVTEMQA
jgi:transposase-like protein